MLRTDWSKREAYGELSGRGLVRPRFRYSRRDRVVAALYDYRRSFKEEGFQ